METKFDSIIGNTMEVIANDLQVIANEMGEQFDSEMLAEGSIDLIPMYGNDDELIEEFTLLPYNKQLEIAKKVAVCYV